MTPSAAGRALRWSRGSAIQHAAPALRAPRVALFQLEPPIETVIAAVAIARSAGARVVLDPAPPLPDELLAKVDVIRPNAERRKC